MTLTAEEIRPLLDNTEACPPGTMPVITKTDSRGAQRLGFAADHATAETLALSCGISCSKISRAMLPGDDRPFFVLH